MATAYKTEKIGQQISGWDDIFSYGLPILQWQELLGQILQVVNQLAFYVSSSLLDLSGQIDTAAMKNMIPIENVNSLMKRVDLIKASLIKLEPQNITAILRNPFAIRRFL